MNIIFEDAYVFVSFQSRKIALWVVTRGLSIEGTEIMKIGKKSTNFQNGAPTSDLNAI